MSEEDDEKYTQHEQCEPCCYDKVSGFSLSDFSNDSFQHLLVVVLLLVFC
jgi:hypothetical protein